MIYKEENLTDLMSFDKTSIHLAAKRLFEINKVVTVPYLRTYASELGYEITLMSSNRYSIISITVEQLIGDFKPDIVAEVEIIHQGKTIHRKLIIEIAVTHFCDKLKIKKIESCGLSAIEINLININKNLNDELLWQQLSNQENIKWLFNTQEINLARKVVKSEIEKEERRTQHRQQFFRNSFDDMSKKYKELGLSLLKIYHATKKYVGYEVHEYEFTGNIYCPKLYDKVIRRNECEKCGYHHTVLNDFSASEYKVVCGFRNKIKANVELEK